MMKRFVVLLFFGSLLLVPSCGYHLSGRGGTSPFLPADIRQIGIPPLENETEKPELEQRITESLIDEFVRRGRYETLPSAAGADAVLEGAILSYRTEPVTFTGGGQFDRVEVIITASMRLTRITPEKVLWSQNHYVYREQFDVPETPTAAFDPDIIAIEQIAAEFARAVVTSIFEGF